jgi:protein arginine N-methyltransferase 5
LNQFITHNIKAVIIPFSIFITNKSGYPVLPMLHQKYIQYLFRFKIDVIFSDDSNLISEGNIENITKIKDYYLYICHLFKTHQEFQSKDYILCNYLDVFQIPLQPLRDNLPSQTYECFEEDNVKYDQYEKALIAAFENFKKSNFLNQGKTFKIIEGRILHICALGAGRGPLVRRVVKSSQSCGLEVKISCIEKNRNAFNTLLNLKVKEPEIFKQVKMYFTDMRDFVPEEKIDIVVSELLGSFGDNELSPECLLGIQKFLSEDSIMIPQSYTSYIQPVTCPSIWTNVKKIKDNYQVPYVILFHKAYYPITEVRKCLTFDHPIDIMSLNQFCQNSFEFKEEAVIHGVAGYFHSVLYGDVTLSTLPSSQTQNMHSWFPIYFPSIHPINLNKGEELRIYLSRNNDKEKVWYEWSFEIVEEGIQTSNSISFIHNSGGASYSIKL